MISLKERVINVLKGKKNDYVPWYADLSYWIYSLNKENLLPDKYKGDGMYNIYKDLGVGYYHQGYWPYKKVFEGVDVMEEKSETHKTITVKTPLGNLHGVEEYLPSSYSWGRTKYLVNKIQDLKIVRYWYEHTHYEPDYDLAYKRHGLIGDNGIVECYLPRSPLMQMLAELSCIETATYMMCDDEDEFNDTLNVLREKADEAAGIVINSPADVLQIPENLSSELVGKNLYNKYMKDYEESINAMVRKSGKYSSVHMDGTLRGLISEVASAGFDILEALTPSPVGDLPLDELRKYVKEETVIWGGLPGAFFDESITDGDFDRYVVEALQIMKTQPRFILGVADQVPPGTKWDRIKRVGELVEKYGAF